MTRVLELGKVLACLSRQTPSAPDRRGDIGRVDLNAAPDAAAPPTAQRSLVAGVGSRRRSVCCGSLGSAVAGARIRTNGSNIAMGHWEACMGRTVRMAPPPEPAVMQAP